MPQTNRLGNVCLYVLHLFMTPETAKILYKPKYAAYNWKYEYLYLSMLLYYHYMYPILKPYCAKKISSTRARFTLKLSSPLPILLYLLYAIVSMTL